MSLIATLVIMIMQVSPGEQSRRPSPLTVCDVLADPLHFNGKIIEVRGYVTSTDEGSWLKGDCKTHLVTDGFVWPNSISLALSPDPVEPLHEKTFSTDLRALRELSEKTAEVVRLHGNTCRFWITYEGMIQTQPDLRLETFLDVDGKRRAAGFGHLGGAPAQLVIKTVRDLRVEYPHPTKSNGERSK